MASLNRLLSVAQQERLDSEGWVTIRGLDGIEAVRNLAASFSETPPQFSGRLAPKAPGGMGARSFSFHHGYDRFPMHTDTAFWRYPARYVVLMAESSSPVATLICSANAVAEMLAGTDSGQAIFSVRNVDGYVYQGIHLARCQAFVRFDSCYMTPANKAARNVVSALSYPAESFVSAHHWTGSEALVIDNWRCLHGRAPVHSDDTTRSLLRFYVLGEAHELGQGSTLE